MVERKATLSNSEILDHLTAFLNEPTKERSLEELREEDRLAGDDPDQFVRRIKTLVNATPASFEPSAVRSNPTIDGPASSRLAWERRAPRWSALVLAAGFAGVMIAGGWLWTWQRARLLQADLTRQVSVARERLGRLEAENQQLRAEQDRANRAMAQPSARTQSLVSLNVPIRGVYSTGSTRRPERASITEVSIPRDARLVTLILYSESEGEYPDYSLEIVNSQKQVVWRAQGLRRNAEVDGYTISLPTELLPPGLYTLNVYGEANGQRTRAERYLVRIVTESS